MPMLLRRSLTAAKGLLTLAGLGSIALFDLCYGAWLALRATVSLPTG